MDGSTDSPGCLLCILNCSTNGNNNAIAFLFIYFSLRFYPLLKTQLRFYLSVFFWHRVVVVDGDGKRRRLRFTLQSGRSQVEGYRACPVMIIFGFFFWFK